MLYLNILSRNCFMFFIAFMAMQCGQPSIQTEVESFQLQIGAASAPVNPEIGSFIAGDKQNRKFTDIHDSLFVKAVVLSDGSQSMAILTVDCIGLLYPEIQSIRLKALNLIGSIDLPADNIIISSSHTHSGPDVVGIWGQDFQHSGVDPKYIDFLAETAANQIKMASDNLEPVKVLVGEMQFENDWVQNISDKEIDHTLTVLQFINSKGENIASLTSYACHPTYLDSKFSVVSADYLYGFYKEMNSKLGGENLFLQGAIGGWVQPVDGEGTLEKAERRGREIAQAAIKSLENADNLSETNIQLRNKKVKFLVENEGWKQLSAMGTINRNIKDSVETEIVWFAIGSAQFITHPGETAPFYALESKKLMGPGPKIVVGLGMDALGYILKPEYFENENIPHAPYLTSMSLGKNTGPEMMDAIMEVIP